VAAVEAAADVGTIQTTIWIIGVVEAVVAENVLINRFLM
jgi:hypothetical protein